MTAPRTILDVHVVQTVPPSNLNRDDTGSPKTAVFGGKRRARVSSQSWKRAIRKDFQKRLDPDQLGTRTKLVVSRVADEIGRRDPSKERAEAVALAQTILEAAGIKSKAAKAGKNDLASREPEAEALAFLSTAQIEALADHVLEVGNAVDKAKAKELADTEHSIDIALFGRMVASNPALNVDAACQVAHSISTHAVSNEFDYFTAVDDEKDREESVGAGMVGVVEFNSATLYRFATVDIDRLVENLGDAAAAVSAATEFLRSMITSMPSGKQNTFANRTLPDAVVVMLRSDQPVSMVNAFERPVESDGGLASTSVERLASYGAGVAETWGSTSDQAWVVALPDHAGVLQALGERVSLEDAVHAVRAALDARLGTE